MIACKGFSCMASFNSQNKSTSHHRQEVLYWLNSLFFRSSKQDPQKILLAGQNTGNLHHLILNAAEQEIFSAEQCPQVCLSANFGRDRKPKCGFCCRCHRLWVILFTIRRAACGLCSCVEIHALISAKSPAAAGVILSLYIRQPKLGLHFLQREPAPFFRGSPALVELRHEPSRSL